MSRHEAIPEKMILRQELDKPGCVARYKVCLVAKRYIRNDFTYFDEKLASGMPLDVLLLIVGNIIARGLYVSI